MEQFCGTADTTSLQYEICSQTFPFLQGLLLGQQQLLWTRKKLQFCEKQTTDNKASYLHAKQIHSHKQQPLFKTQDRQSPFHY